MTLSDDLPPQLTKDVKRRNRKRRSVKSKDVEVLLSVATRVARIAKDKGYYTVSPEAIRCVEVLRMMRSLPLTPRLITKTNALRSLQFLATNVGARRRGQGELSSKNRTWEQLMDLSISISVHLGDKLSKSRRQNGDPLTSIPSRRQPATPGEWNGSPKWTRPSLLSHIRRVSFHGRR
ncbi:hypothetical protein YC2023_010221 [Brassica napus]